VDNRELLGGRISIFALRRLAVIGSEAVDLVRVDDRSIRRRR